MKFSDLQQSDFLKILSADNDVAVTIVSTEGQVISYTRHAPSVFGAIDNHDYHGNYLGDIFTCEFTDRWLRLIRQAVEEDRPIKTRLILDGDRIASTIVPLDRDTQPPYAAILTRRDELANKSDKIETEAVVLTALEPLSQRELEVFILLGHGYSVPESAKILHRSPRTIEQHKANIGRKIGKSSIADIARMVGEYGLQLNRSNISRESAVRPQYQRSTSTE